MGGDGKRGANVQKEERLRNELMKHRGNRLQLDFLCLLGCPNIAGIDLLGKAK